MEPGATWGVVAGLVKILQGLRFHKGVSGVTADSQGLPRDGGGHRQSRSASSSTRGRGPLSNPGTGDPIVQSP